MARIKRGKTARARHKKILALAKGFRHGRKNLFRMAKQAVIRAGQYAYRDRKVNKRVRRSQWIVTLNAAVRQHDMSYSKFIFLLNKSDVNLDRKILADLAENHPEEFDKVFEQITKTA